MDSSSIYSVEPNFRELVTSDYFLIIIFDFNLLGSHPITYDRPRAVRHFSTGPLFWVPSFSKFTSARCFSMLTSDFSSSSGHFSLLKTTELSPSAYVLDNKQPSFCLSLGSRSGGGRSNSDMMLSPHVSHWHGNAVPTWFTIHRRSLRRVSFETACSSQPLFGGKPTIGSPAIGHGVVSMI